MGPVALPLSGVVYADADVIIYSVQEHPVYSPLLEPLWHAVHQGSVTMRTSELSLVEVLTGAYKSQDQRLAAAYERFLVSPNIEMVPISQSVLRAAARLRAASRLRTPDAIHAATAQTTECRTFLTNDGHYRGATDITALILDDLLEARSL